MGLELRIVYGMEQDIYLIPNYEVARVLERSSPFAGRIPTKAEMTSFLTKVNGALIERSDARSALYEHYITAASVYACAQPVMHLHIPEKIMKAFIAIAERKPYRLNLPLEIILTTTEKDAQHIIGPLLNAQLADIEEEVPEKLAAKFTMSELIRHTLARCLNDVANRISRRYCDSDHLLFVSIKDICLPLFGMGQRGYEYRELSLYLQEHYGHLHLKVPRCLAPEEKEAA